MSSYTIAYPFVCVVAIALVMLAGFFRLWGNSLRRVTYALVPFITKVVGSRGVLVTRAALISRLLLLVLLAFFMAQPQRVDKTEVLTVKGIDIIVALDVSGSMRLFDELKGRSNRFEAAKREARAFIKRRTNDPIGVVLFAEAALFRLPLTLDKVMLDDVIGQLELGDIPQNGTKLLTGLGLALNKLRLSNAPSKVVVLLTDGMPEGESLDAETLIAIAKKHDIRIYTIGVGRNDFAYDYDPRSGQVAKVPTKLDTTLLQKIADETGGLFFRAHDTSEMKAAYEAIDALEKSDREAPIFYQHHELFGAFWGGVIALLACGELMLRLVAALLV